MTENVWISLGSNLSNPIKQIKNALKNLSSIPNCTLINHSHFYYNAPFGLKNQPNFINAIAKINTSLDPELLLKYTQKIEQKQGRTKKTTRWSARILDLDILLFGMNIINTNDLIIPHYDILNREFMLYPLLELSPNIFFTNGKKIKFYLKKLEYKKNKTWNYLKI